MNIGTDDYNLKFKYTFLNQINDKLKKVNNTSEILEKEERKCFFMAKIIENERRIVKLSVDDVLNIVREYQRLTRKSCCYNHTREILAQNNIYIPEDV